MKRKNRYISACLAILFSVLSPVHGQSRKELERQRKKKEQEIALTRKILRETSSKKQKSLKEIVSISRLIEKREELIETINLEIHAVNRDAELKKAEIEMLNAQIHDEKKHYAKALVQSYKSKKVYNNSLYFFAAQSFNQFFLRLRFNSYLNAAQEKFLFRIHENRKMLEEKLSELLGLKMSKEQLAKNKVVEVRELEKNKKDKNNVVAALSGKEKELKQKLEKQKKAKASLNAQINSIIAREMAAAREKAKKQAEARAKSAGGATDNKKSPEKIPEVTPEVRKLSDNFAANKGRLPWPVEKGFISERFGTHAHAKLDQVTVQNNGIDIRTSSGSTARCIHKGIVTAVFSIPGMGKAVIISHGEFFTVYSKLKTVNVAQGQTVALHQTLGTIAEDEDGVTEIHLEIWHNQEKQNPESWLAK